VEGCFFTDAAFENNLGCDREGIDECGAGVVLAFMQAQRCDVLEAFLQIT